MKFATFNTVLLLVSMLLVGCGGGSSTSLTDGVVVSKENVVSISGTVSYDLIAVNDDYIGLNYTNIVQAKAKLVLVEAINGLEQVVDTTTTDTEGVYTLNNIPESINVKIRVSAKMIQTGTPAWDVKVVDNTNSDALYVMEGALVTSGTNHTTRNLNAPSGWDGGSYTSARTAAPFALLDTTYKSMQKVLSADPQTVFPPLQINWSTENITQGTYYTDGNLYILGDAHGDTDEYDDHVIAHEWGHYYEDKFSRSDSLGGSHSGEERLDIRVAFAEGWGNAFSGMALKDPVYFDTFFSISGTSTGFNFNVESGTSSNRGWYSESSIQRILYDIYDSDDDGDDRLHLGFSSIHQVFTNTEKTTPAFTSIFSFIKALKDAHTSDAEDIDTIVSSENIAMINDIYGTGRTNTADAYPYHDMSVDSAVLVQTGNSDGSYNKLSNRQYVKFTIDAAGSYTIKVQQTNGTNSDPDFYLYKSEPFSFITSSESATAGVEDKTLDLTTGAYLLDIGDYNNVVNAHYAVTVSP